MLKTLYVTTVDEKNSTHNYRLPVTETVPEGQDIVAVRPAGNFRFSSLLSPESLASLKVAVSRKR